jgi:hypothetical protein
MNIRMGFNLTVLLVLMPARAGSDIEPDTGLAVRQEAALSEVAENLVPERDYPGTDPAAAAPWARHMAEAITRLMGTEADPGPCAWETAGAPGIMNAAAALAYALHRYGEGWPADVKEAVRAAAQDAWWGDPGPYLANGRIAIVAAELLAGEALGLGDLFAAGVGHLDVIFERTVGHGGIEMNAPLYTAHHFPILIFLQVLEDEGAREKARILLEYELLVQAHMVLPGGGLGAPQSRDYSGGAADGGDRAMLPVLWLLVGDPDYEADLANAYDFIVAAATDYVVPEIIRSIFLDKEDGYCFWTYTDAQQGSSRTPHAVYNLGLDGGQAIPWQTVVMPGGAASLGLSYGYRLTALYVSSGTYVRSPAGGFAILYQYQPMVTGDTDDTGSVQGGSGLNDDPDDFTSELYDFERLAYLNAAITLWDPTARDGVVRTHEDTRVHIPDYEALGGEAAAEGDWRIGRLGEIYVAYRPLGTIAVEEARSDYVYMRLDGPSGGIVELASTADFATIGDYAADLASRSVSFTSDPLAAEFEAHDPATGGTALLRLEYRPEKRLVDGVELSVEEALDHGLMESPWAAWSADTRVLSVRRGCYPSMVYDWSAGTVTVEDPPPECGLEPDADTVEGSEPMPDAGPDGGPDGIADGAPDAAGDAIDAEADDGDDGAGDGGGGGCGCSLAR